LELTPLAWSLTFQSKQSDIWKQSDVYAQINLWNEMYFHTKLNAERLEDIVKSTEVGRIIAIWLQESESGSNGLRGKVEQINVQKAIQPIEQLREVPTCLGFPISFRMNLPIIVSTVGQIALKGQGSQQRVHADIYLSLVGQFKARLTAKIPYTMRYYQVGYEKNLAIELPLRIVAQKTKYEAVQIAVTPTHLDNNGQPQGDIRIVSYDQVPYTAVIKDPWARHLSEKYEDFEIIRTGRPQQQKFNLGREELGMKFTFEMESDKPSRSSNSWDYFLYKNYNFTLDLDESKTNTILFSLGQGRASQLQRSSGSSSSSDESSDDSSDSAQGNSVESGTNIRKGYVAALAITGKQSVVQSLDNRATTIDEIDPKSAKSTFQFLFQFVGDDDQDEGFFRVAKGSAANKAAYTLPQNGGLKVVREAISQSSEYKQQDDFCFQATHKVKSSTPSNVMAGKTTVEAGESCANLHKLNMDFFMKFATDFQAELKVRDSHNLPSHIQAVARRVEQSLRSAMSHGSPRALQMAVQAAPLKFRVKYSPKKSTRQEFLRGSGSFEDSSSSSSSESNSDSNSQESNSSSDSVEHKHQRHYEGQHQYGQQHYQGQQKQYYQAQQKRSYGGQY